MTTTKPLHRRRTRRTSPLATLLVIASALAPSSAQDTGRSASELLKHALHLADLYNWGDAAPDFAEAERLFNQAGDERNALYARLGKIRAEAERGALPEIAAELEAELESNPLLQTDKGLRMFALIVKGDIVGEMRSPAMRDDWEKVLALARELGDAKWQYRALGQLGLAAFYGGDPETARKERRRRPPCRQGGG